MSNLFNAMGRFTSSIPYDQLIIEQTSTTSVYNKDNELTLTGDAICVGTLMSYGASGAYIIVNNVQISSNENNNHGMLTISSSFFASINSILKVQVKKSASDGSASAAKVQIKIRYI